MSRSSRAMPEAGRSWPEELSATGLCRRREISQKVLAAKQRLAGAIRIASGSEVGTFIKVKHPYGHSLAAGIGIVAGLRPMTAPAIIAWAAKRRWINLGSRHSLP